MFYQDLTKLSSVKSNKEHTHTKKINIVYNKASKLYNELLRRYFNEYKNFCSSKQLSLDMIRKIYLLNFIIIVIGLKKDKLAPESFDEEKPIDISLEGYEEEIKEEKGLNIFTSNKLLTRLPILLAQTKGENNSNKLKK